MLRIRYSNGRVLEGILLAMGDHAVRVAIKGADDVAEYRLISQRWVSEDCEVVAITCMEEDDFTLASGEETLDGIMASGFDRPVASRIM